MWAMACNPGRHLSVLSRALAGKELSLPKGKFVSGHKVTFIGLNPRLQLLVRVSPAGTEGGGGGRPGAEFL